MAGKGELVQQPRQEPDRRQRASPKARAIITQKHPRQQTKQPQAPDQGILTPHPRQKPHHQQPQTTILRPRQQVRRNLLATRSPEEPRYQDPRLDSGHHRHQEHLRCLPEEQSARVLFLICMIIHYSFMFACCCPKEEEQKGGQLQEKLIERERAST